MAHESGEEDPVIALGKALSLVRKAIATAEKGLLLNPSTVEQRELNETLVELELKKAKIRAQLDAQIAASTTIAGPTAAQVVEISSLTAEVEELTNASITASAAVALTSKVLALATEVVSAAQDPGTPAG
jgi:hypothetical protein